MKTILADLNETIAARGSVVVSQDGMLIAADVRDGVDLDRLAALGAAIVEEIVSSLRSGGYGDLTQLEIAAEHGKLVFVRAGPTYLLVMLGARLEIGPGSLEIRSAAQKIAKDTELVA